MTSYMNEAKEVEERMKQATFSARFRCFWFGHDPHRVRVGKIGIGVLQRRECKRCRKPL